MKKKWSNNTWIKTLINTVIILYFFLQVTALPPSTRATWWVRVRSFPSSGTRVRPFTTCCEINIWRYVYVHVINRNVATATTYICPGNIHVLLGVHLLWWIYILRLYCTAHIFTNSGVIRGCGLYFLININILSVKVVRCSNVVIKIEPL